MFIQIRCIQMYYCTLILCVCVVCMCTLQVTIFSDPMVSALTALTEVENSKYTGSSTFTKGQYIPIGGNYLCSNFLSQGIDCHYVFTVFYVSFVITPLCSNASELVSSLMFAAKRTKVNASLTYSQVRSHIIYTSNTKFIQLHVGFV